MLTWNCYFPGCSRAGIWVEIRIQFDVDQQIIGQLPLFIFILFVQILENYRLLSVLHDTVKVVHLQFLAVYWHSCVNTELINLHNTFRHFCKSVKQVQLMSGQTLLQCSKLDLCPTSKQPYQFRHQLFIFNWHWLTLSLGQMSLVALPIQFPLINA